MSSFTKTRDQLAADLREWAGDLDSVHSPNELRTWIFDAIGILQARMSEVGQDERRIGASKRVMDAIEALGDGERGVRVRLADLRHALWRMQRDEVDQVLIGLSRTGIVALFPLDDPHDRTREDDQAALDLSGVPQHLVYLS